MKKLQGHQLVYCTKTCFKVQVSTQRINIGAPKRVARAIFSPPMTTSKERAFIVDSGASLHTMSNSDLTPEEQQAVRKSKDPAFIMTATVSTHTSEEATENMCDLDKFVQVQLLKESLAVQSP